MKAFHYNEYSYDLTRLQKFVEKFKTTEIWKTMSNTVEDSPWHREANVAVHTEMSLEAAKQWFPTDTSDVLARRHITLVTLAILFHDVGKPIAEVTKESETRGVYRSYANHEQDSARAWEDYYVNHWGFFAHIIDHWDAYVITWMIEHHLPYGIKDKNKVAALDSSVGTMFYPNDQEVFFNALRGDAYGRVSDNWDANTTQVNSWVADMRRRIVDANYDVKQLDPGFKLYDPNRRTLYVFIAPPGAGKSTWIKEYYNIPHRYHSLDALRLEYFAVHDSKASAAAREAGGEVEEYRQAWGFVNAEPHDKLFPQWANDHFTQQIKAGGQDVVVDNTNTSAKRRRFYLTQARQRGMRTVAIYFPTSVDMLKMRNDTREGKKVPEPAIRALYNSINVPSIGRDAEFDEVLLATENLYSTDFLKLHPQESL